MASGFSRTISAQQSPVFRWAGDPEGGAPFLEADPTRPDNLVGFDVEIAGLMARGLGRRPEFVNVDFRSIDQSVARGDAEIGIQQVSEIYAASGADLVGPFPPEVQKLTVFSAGIFSGTRQEDAAQSLIRFLKTPASARVMKTKGLEPVKK